jgi:hypothetical protein
MRYLRKFNESVRFNDRDYSNYIPQAGNWYISSDSDAYVEIKREFNIEYDDLGYILLDFLEHFDLAYRCKYDDRLHLIQIEFFPNLDLEDLASDDLSFIKWFYSKLSDEKNDSEYLDFLEEIDGRLSEYKLTLRRNLPETYRKNKKDFPFDFFGGERYLQLWIGRI